MPLEQGTEVAVLTLGRKRGQIVGVIRAGVYRVRVETLILTCREEDLQPVEPRKRRRPAPAPAAPPPGAPAGEEESPDAGALRTLDLHGLSVDEARNRVAGHISRAILAGLDRIEIIHGIGSGAIRRAVTTDLKRLSAVKHVRPHPTNPGVTIVQF